MQRRIELATWGLLALAAVWVLASLFQFGQQRFFTVDEWQYGHATWLVAQGQRPYVDFFEHHFPLSYVMHAPLLGDGSFAERALRLRSLGFLWVLGAALVVAAGALRASGEPALALLSASLPFAIGFSAMSIVDYRADNFGALAGVAMLALLEANRRPHGRGRGRGRGVAAAAGVLFAVAIFMTQKMIFLAGGAVAIFWLWDRLAGTNRDPFLAAPGAFCLGAAAVTALVLLAGAASGVLGRGFDLTVLQAIAHERQYPPRSVMEWAVPFLAATRVSSALLAAGLAAFLALGLRRHGFWAVPLAVAVVAGWAVRAQYPYNYVYLCLVAGICVVRGVSVLVERVGEGVVWRPALYLLPLALLPQQLAFLDGVPTLDHQLALLAKIERFSTPDDAVIDGAGGALFRPHGSYWWYHGEFQRAALADYFASDLIDDYRASGALFWIHDFRQQKLPQPVQDYFRSHYIQAEGRLYVLGVETPAGGGRARELEFDVLRAGEWLAGPKNAAVADPSADAGLRLDGEPLRAGRVTLSAGLHRLTLSADAPAWRLSPAPAGVFRRTEPPGAPPYTMLFAYDESERRR